MLAGRLSAIPIRPVGGQVWLSPRKNLGIVGVLSVHQADRLAGCRASVDTLFTPDSGYARVLRSR